MGERRISARPLMMMSAGIALVIGVTAILQRTQDEQAYGRLNAVQVSQQEQDACNLCIKAINAIQEDNRQEEQAALDQIVRKKIDLSRNVMGQGALKNNSPGTLMIQLGRALQAQAVRDASAGSAASGRHAILECRRLSEHILGAPNPSLAALTISHSLYRLANEAEARIYPGRSNLSSDEKFFWRTSVLAGIQQWRGEWDRKPATASEREASESELAARLTARYRLFRVNRLDQTTATATPAVTSRPAAPTPLATGAA